MRIHQDQVWRQRRRRAKRLAAIGGGTNKNEIANFLQDLGEDLQH